MFYTRLTVTCNPDFTEILIAELSEGGFETFLETDTGLEAYVEEAKYDEHVLDQIKIQYQDHTPVHYQLDRIEKENWNTAWEKNYHPIRIEDKCLVRAAFHESEESYPYEIVITPKMSFGTGHHQTTWLMLKAQLELDHQDKVVMDAGCGTAILAIMAAKRGARKVEAFDIDEWCIENGNENIEANQCDSLVHIRKGQIRDLTFDEPFDLILANINRNVLLDEIPQYAAHLQPGGLLLLSGFYEQDIPALIEKASLHRLVEVKREKKDAWASLLLKQQA